MRDEWLNLCMRLSCTPATYWSGGKKIIRQVSHRFSGLGPLTIEEVGYSPVKMSLLRNAYVHQESRDAALDQWNNRKNYRPRAHWSTGFSCYNHTLKPHSAKGDDYKGLSSTMGPCLQAVTISHTFEGTAEVDVFYRTTEIFKKFPADLILLRDHLLAGFDFERTPLAGITVWAANVTVSPTYVLTMLALIEDPEAALEEIREADQKLHRLFCRASFQLLTGPESSFNQARRMQRAIKTMMADDEQRALIRYLKKRGYA